MGRKESNQTNKQTGQKYNPIYLFYKCKLFYIKIANECLNSLEYKM